MSSASSRPRDRDARCSRRVRCIGDRACAAPMPPGENERVTGSERRRRAVDALRLAEEVCRYARAQLASGLGPDEARSACLEVAGELEAITTTVRKAARVGPKERRTVARQLAETGLPTGTIAAQLGVCDRTARYYVRGRSERQKRGPETGPGPRAPVF